MPQPLEFYFDFYSPYGYLASLRIDEIAAGHGREVIWRPFLLGPAFAATGHRPLTQTPLMSDYVAHDFARCARRQGVPFKMPEKFPNASLAPSRAYYWLFDRDPVVAKQFARAVYHATFGEGRNSTRSEVVAELAAPLGINTEQLLAVIKGSEAKDRLKKETADALHRGVFGAPFIYVDGEPFWGNDRLEQIEQWLESGGW